MPLLLQRSLSGSQFKSFPNHIPSKRIAPSTSIKENLATRHNQSSPFDTLPVELQVEIFWHCLPGFPTLNADHELLSIALVCRAWKSLALETPKLWSSFEIEVKGSGAAASALDIRLMNAVKLWLLRSKQHQLNIRMTHTPSAQDNESYRSGQILALLMPEVHRWKEIELTMPASNSCILRRVRPEDLPALRSLKLKTSGKFGTSGILNFTLKQVSWRQITRVDLQQSERGRLTISSWLKILSQARRLVECSFNMDCVMDTEPSNIISLPSLKTLRINAIAHHTHSAGFLSQFLNTLCAPNLRVLHLGWSARMKMQPQFSSSSSPMFLPFLRSSAGALRRLTISYLPLSEELLLRYLSILPNITHLSLKYPLNDEHDDPVTDALLSACTFPPPPPSSDTRNYTKAILPMMEHCTIECHGKAYTSAALVAFVESRMAICQNTDADSVHDQRGVMKSFRMLSMKAVMDAVDARVRQWENDGVDITIQSLTVR